MNEHQPRDTESSMTGGDKTENDTPKIKLYYGGNLFGAAIIGTGFASLYMMYENYKQCGEGEKAKEVIKKGLPALIGFYIVLLAIVAYIEETLLEEEITGVGIFAASVVVSVIYFYQKDLFEHHKDSIEHQPLIKAIGVAVGGIVAYFVIATPIVFLVALGSTFWTEFVMG